MSTAVIVDTKMESQDPDDDGFKYGVLQNPASDIRIITIQPAESLFDLVECHLDEVDLAASASSFVVHEPIDPEGTERDHAILCDGLLLYVSEHTYFFLWTLRNQKDGRMRHVWSPRVCINRDNKDEIPSQQKLLPKIYQKAVQRISMAPTYRHKPLPTPDTIRLIEIDSPPLQNGLLKTRLREVSLADNPSYYYLDIRRELTEESWPEKGAFICNNRLLSVSKPLHQVLSMVLSKGPRAFWIEAISVDRRSLLDRKHHEVLTDEKLRKQAKEVIGIRQPKFMYMPLPDSRPHIRLIKILPAPNLDDVLVADIGHFPLDSCPEFVAVSYVWGPLDPKWMVCTRDGRYITCTASLRVALCHLRQRGHFVVWADAICMNQDDKIERSKQVLLMGDIYKRASRVFVELGVNCMNENHRVCRVFPPILINMLALTGKVLQAVRPERPTLDNREYSKFGIPNYGHQAWSGWRAMRAMPWFTRSWIVQEVVAGKEVIVLYNGKSYDWKDLAMANRVTANEQVDIKAYIGKMNMTNIGDLQSEGLDKLPDLFDLVTTFRSLDATDPRDKVYAFRGLAADQDLSPLPNYARSVEDVYLDYATYFVKQGFGIRLLADAGVSRSGRSLPSWVPDWSYNISWQTFNFTKQSSWTSLKAIRETETPKDAQVSLGKDDSRILTVFGTVIDEIVELSSPVSNTYRYNEGPGAATLIDQDIFDLYAYAKEKVPTDTSNSGEYMAKVQTTLLGGSGGLFTPLSDFFGCSKILKHKEPDAQNKQSVTAFDEILRERLSNRRFCLTKDGRMGLFPGISEKGDVVVWFMGATTTMTLRKKGEGYVLIGDAFIDGLVDSKRATGIEALRLQCCEISLC
ncbi:Fc.00g114380.m01.CDS01 [Cosmosporella sp. VM-42]